MFSKCSFGFTRSLFILYVYEHYRLGFGMFITVETAVIPELYLIAFVELFFFVQKMLFLTSELANNAEIAILSARDTTRA